jgi:putative oxidoreductase
MTTDLNIEKKSKGLNIALWTAQGLLALTFIWGAYVKLAQPIEESAKMLPWALDNPGLLKFTGIVDLLGGLGIILPSVLRILPKLTIYAAFGIVSLMVLGSIFHVSRGETPLIGMNVFLILLAIFVAWGRAKKAPVLPKS